MPIPFRSHPITRAVTDRCLLAYLVFQRIPHRLHQLTAVLVFSLCGLIVTALWLSVPAGNSLPLLMAKAPNSYVPLPWDESSYKSDVACNKTGCLAAALNDFPNTRLLKLELTKRFSTVYGCNNVDFLQANGSVSGDSFKPEPPAKPPYRLALLFLVDKKFVYPELWADWFEEARRWSHEMLMKREGPFASFASDEMGAAFDKDFNLFSVKAHVSERKGFSIRNAFFGTPPINLPPELSSNLVPPVYSDWGDLLIVQYQLLKYALQDPHSFGFIFVSDTTIPVKPFSYIYQQFFKNPRSRFFFPNVNLPLIRKHDQWTVLSRTHAAALVQYPKLWVCNTWFNQPYGYFLSEGFWAAPDEYLPFYALSTIIGSSLIWEQINDGFVDEGFPVLNWNATEPPRFYGSAFRHTWVCWKRDGGLNFNGCRKVGQFVPGKNKSPLTFTQVIASEFEQKVLNNSDVWFARKFESDCTIELSSSELSSLTLHHSSGGTVNFNQWLSFKLQSWTHNELQHF